MVLLRVNLVIRRNLALSHHQDNRLNQGNLVFLISQVNLLNQGNLFTQVKLFN